jgi:16S rRNA (cytidine1402-2'-O)-methyltransferase
LHSSQKLKLECALYVVATPIGNMRDISLRALDVLSGADTIAAEDTRNSAHLLTHHGITARRLLALHQHNERGAADKVIHLLAQGQSVALVVEEVRAAGYRVIPIPGANAAVAALSAAGLAAPHFLFYGFLPNKPTARCKELHSLLGHPYTLVFYEAPHRIIECVADLRTVFGDERQIVLAREVTKLFESIHRCRMDEAMDWLNSDPNNLRGEFVVLVSAAPARAEGISAEVEHVLSVLLKELPLKQAVQLAVQITGVARNELYQRALSLKPSE